MSVLLAAAVLWSGVDLVGLLWPLLLPLAGLGMVVGGLALLRSDGAR